MDEVYIVSVLRLMITCMSLKRKMTIDEKLQALNYMLYLSKGYIKHVNRRQAIDVPVIHDGPNRHLLVPPPIGYTQEECSHNENTN
jgi:hypothetical protein